MTGGSRPALMKFLMTAMDSPNPDGPARFLRKCFSGLANFPWQECQGGVSRAIASFSKGA